MKRTALFVALLGGCRDKPTAWPELVFDDSEGSRDLVLAAMVVDSDEKSAVVRTRATWRGAPIDLEIQFIDVDAARRPFGICAVVIQPAQRGADPLLAALASRWGLPPAERRWRPGLRAHAAVFGGSPRTIRTRGIRTKIFVGDPERESDAELFVSFDPKGSLALREKDYEYRARVVAAFAR
jgi:hypothetical protein